jgi:hypothetical protein
MYQVNIEVFLISKWYKHEGAFAGMSAWVNIKKPLHEWHSSFLGKSKNPF